MGKFEFKSFYIRYICYLLQEIECKINRNDSDKDELYRVKNFINKLVIPKIEKFEYDKSITSDFQMMSIIDDVHDIIKDANLNVYQIWQETNWSTILRQRKIEIYIND